MKQRVAVFAIFDGTFFKEGIDVLYIVRPLESRCYYHLVVIFRQTVVSCVKNNFSSENHVCMMTLLSWPFHIKASMRQWACASLHTHTHTHTHTFIHTYTCAKTWQRQRHGKWDSWGLIFLQNTTIQWNNNYLFRPKACCTFTAWEMGQS